MASLLAMCVMTVWAKPVSKKAARQVAQEFMQRQLSVQGSHRAPQMVSVEAAQGSQENEYVYLFNASDGQGFVVVSGDDSTAPILGYSTQGRIDAGEMPQNLRSWLQHYADQIAYIQNNNISVPRRTIANCGPAIAPQLTAKWGQNPIYNDQCPMVTLYADEACTQRYEYPVTDDEGNITGTSTDPIRAVTGCTATSMAQVLYHHKYPAASTADIPARENVVIKGVSNTGVPFWNKFSDEEIAAGTPFDWDHMADAYGTYMADDGNFYLAETTEEQNFAVAQLMHLCGAAMGMEYGTLQGAGSTASPTDMLNAAVKYLGLSNAILCYQEDYDYLTWIQTLYDEIMIAGCTCFGGSSLTSGHAFVIDGYDKEDFFHLNWGWAGQANGYFRINDLTPANGAMDFSNEQAYLLGLYPGAPQVAPAPTVTLFVTTASSVTAQDGAFSVPSVTIAFKNKMVPEMAVEMGFTVEGQDIKTTTSFAPGQLGILHLDEQLVLNNVTLPLGALADGTYKLYLSYRLAVSDEWTPCRDSDRNSIELTVSGNTMTLANELPYTLSLESVDGYQPIYQVGSPISMTANIKVVKGSIHEPIVVSAGKFDDNGQVDVSTIKPVIQKSVYAEEGETFSIPIAFGVGSECKMFVTLQGKKTGIGMNVCTFEVTQATGVDAIRQDATPTSATYNLSGQRVADDYRGIVIRNGQKIVR